MTDDEKKVLEEMAKQSCENFGTSNVVRMSVFVYRDMLILEGYSRERANEIVLKNSKEQGSSEKELKDLSIRLKQIRQTKKIKEKLI